MSRLSFQQALQAQWLHGAVFGFVVISRQKAQVLRNASDVAIELCSVHDLTRTMRAI